MKYRLVVLALLYSSKLFAMYPFQSPYLNQSNIDLLRTAVESNRKSVILTMNDDKKWNANVVSEIDDNYGIIKSLTLLPRNYIGYVQFVIYSLEKRGDFKNSRYAIQWTAHFIASKSTSNKKGVYYLIPLNIKKKNVGSHDIETNKIFVIEVSKSKRES